jgi:G3E family GTPase
MIETTGLADPAPIIQTFFTVPELSQKLRVDGVITVVDAKHVNQHLDEVKPKGIENESVEQIAFADRVILNKIDLVSEEEREDTLNRIKEINKFANVIVSQNSVVDLDKILNIRAFDLNKIMDFDPDFLVKEFVSDDHDHEHDHKGKDCDHHSHKHDEHEHKHEKHDHEHTGDDCAHDSHKTHKKKHQHKHDTTVTSVGIVTDGALMMDKLNQWMGKLLREKGADIYRMKGVLSIHRMDNRFVFQGVHMLFKGEPAQAWGNDKRINKLVFIGKNLNREELENGLKSCMFTEPV